MEHKTNDRYTKITPHLFRNSSICSVKPHFWPNMEREIHLPKGPWTRQWQSMFIMTWYVQYVFYDNLCSGHTLLLDRMLSLHRPFISADAKVLGKSPFLVAWGGHSVEWVSQVKESWHCCCLWEAEAAGAGVQDHPSISSLKATWVIRDPVSTTRKKNSRARRDIAIAFFARWGPEFNPRMQVKKAKLWQSLLMSLTGESEADRSLELTGWPT